MVLVALGLRLVVMMFLYKEQLDPAIDHWAFAYEVGRVARSIVQGHGISSPLFTPTGPSAWMTPVFPYMVAGVFKVFGLYTKASAFVLLSFDALVSALTCIPIFFIARKDFGERAAKYAGWGWAFLPYGIYFPVERIWPTWLATLMLTLLFLLVLYLKDVDNLWAWTGYGLFWGLAALTEPTLLSVLPFLSVWACYHLFRQRKRWFAPAAISAIAFILVVSPWFIRNYRLFHQFIPFRDTMGLEWAIGNSGYSFHWRPPEVGPWHNPAVWRELQKVGEIQFMAEKKRQAFTFIESHWGWFARQSVRRFVYIWTGFWSFNPKYLAQEPLDPPNIFFSTIFSLLTFVGLWRVLKIESSTAVPYLMVLAVFPFIYYITHPEVYYRREIDPLMVILAMLVIARWGKRAEKAVSRSELRSDEEKLQEILISKQLLPREGPAD